MPQISPISWIFVPFVFFFLFFMLFFSVWWCVKFSFLFQGGSDKNESSAVLSFWSW